MPTTQKTPEEQAVFRYRVKQAREKLPRSATKVLTTVYPHLKPEQVYNVLRTPIRCYDDEVLKHLEELAERQPKPAMAA